MSQSYDQFIQRKSIAIQDAGFELKMRPLLRWHGGKWILAPWIISHFPKHRCYVEPFGGAGSVLLRKERTYAEVYNDLDSEVVNLFNVVREYGSELRLVLKLTPFSRHDFKQSYETDPDPVEQARRTVVRSFMGFGSNSHNKATGFRSNSSRSGTTPAQDWWHPDCLDFIIERLRGVVIENRDASEVLRQHDGAETLHYVDPPYVPSTRDRGGDYRHEMTEADHVNLAETLKGLVGMVTVSGYPSSLYSDLYHDWTLVTRKAHADGARDRTECLWLNEAAQSRRITQGFLGLKEAAV